MPKTLITGSTGFLGSKLLKAFGQKNALGPTRQEMDVTQPDGMIDVLESSKCETLIHCAAMARMKQCEEDPSLAWLTNVTGTANLVQAVREVQLKEDRKIRFIYISTDGVYACKTGNYRETSATIPYNIYGWSKLAGECAVRTLKNHCIIRTRFFDPDDIPFDDAATDLFTSSIPIDELVNAILFLVKSKFNGVINIGGDRRSDYDRIKKYKPEIKCCTRLQYIEKLGFEIATDASMDCSEWEQLQKNG